jgi:hypothetical protein
MEETTYSLAYLPADMLLLIVADVNPLDLLCGLKRTCKRLSNFVEVRI